MNDDMIDSFIDESTTHINDINTALIDLENDPDDDDAMDAIFRSAHTLKGNAGAMGFDGMSNLAHAIEDVLDEIRDGNIEVDAEVIDDLFEGIDLFEEMMDEVTENGESTADASDTIDTLRAYLEDGDSDEESDTSISEITDDDIDTILEEVDDGESTTESVYHVRSSVSDEESDSPIEALSDAFTVYASYEQQTDDGVTVDVLITTGFGRENIEMAMDSVDPVNAVSIEDVTSDVPWAGEDESASGGGDPFEDMDVDGDELDDIEINEVDGGGGGSFDFDADELSDDDGDDDFDFDDDDDVDLDFDDDGDDDDLDIDFEGDEGDDEIQNEGAMKFADMKDDVEEASYEEVKQGMEEEGFDLTTDEDSGEDIDVDELLSGDSDLSELEGEDEDDPSHENIEFDIDFDGEEGDDLDDVEDDSMDNISDDFGDMLDTSGPDSLDEDEVEMNENGDVVFSGPDEDDDGSLSKTDLDSLFDGDDSESSAGEGPDLSEDATSSESGLPEFEEILREEEGDVEFEGDDDDLDIQSIKVGVGQLDELSSLVQELVTTRLRLKEVVDRLAEESDSDVATTAQMRASELDTITSQIQDTVMDIRLVPLEHATQRLPRIARDVARENDKKVDFDVEGEDVELDRTILSRLGDPLMHLVRNAVDHGIEPPEEREEEDKPDVGSVRVRADRSKDHVVVTVEDDGGGIDADAVRRKSVEKGLFTEEQAEKMSDQQAYELILRPGFSTRDEVTETSGRGVGMDVVYTMVQSVDGSIDVYSEGGVGTRIELNLPVSLAIDEVMFVEVAGQTFGVPVKNIDDITTTDELTSVDKKPVVMHDGDSYPLIRLQEEFDLVPESDTKDVDELIEDEEKRLIRIDESIRQVTLEVDRVIESEEVVVEPFDGVLSRISGLSGAAVLAEGNVVNILDVNSL